MCLYTSEIMLINLYYILIFILCDMYEERGWLFEFTIDNERKSCICTNYLLLTTNYFF